MGILEILLDDAGPDVSVEDAVIGVFGCMVVSRRAGLSSSFRGRCGGTQCSSGNGGGGAANAGDFIGMSARGLAEYARSDNLLDASVGVAALNSLLVPDPASLTEINAYELIAGRGRGKTIAVVGHFPFVERLRRIADVRLVQKEPWERDEAFREAEGKIPGCDVVAITGSSIINHTFDHILSLSRSAFVIVLGASTPLSSKIFQMGADILCGTVVDDVDAAKRHITQGATFREVRGIRRVAMVK